jgi:predicted RND superfamily exporter protein
MAAAGLELNLFNIVVLPTIIGVGIDNAIHIRHAHLREGRGSIPRVIAGCGKAALLSSATTAIGFGAAALAHHVGIASLGWLALLGVACAFVGSTVALPALLSLVDRARTDAEANDSEPACADEGPALGARHELALGATQPRVHAESSSWRVG